MNVYTAHLRPQGLPMLVREGWSWAAFLFGPLWLLAQRAWIPAVLVLAAFAWLFALSPARFLGPLAFGVAALTGMTGRDMVRWSLARRGYVLAHIVAARDEDAALARLFAARDDLLERLR